MKRAAFWLSSILAVLASFHARADFPSDPKAVGRWMSYYYVEKDAQSVGEFMSWLATNSILDKNRNAEPPTVGFMAAVFADNPDRVRAWVTGPSFSGNAKSAVERALWLSHNGKLISEVFHDQADYASTEPKSVMQMPLNSPSLFDMLWASFFATGDVRYPERLIDVLDDSKSLTDDKRLDAVYRQTAEWSLMSNMHQHELIRRMLVKEAGSRTGAVQRTLQAMIAQDEKARSGLASRSGDFSALLVLMSETDLKEFGKSSDQGLSINELDKAKPGDRIAIKVAFGGMELMDDLKADVSYNVTVLAPDGGVYDQHKDVPALQAKVPLRFSVFDNSAVEVVRFDPKDARGTYKVNVELNDNVGRRTISLSKQIELTN